MILKVRFCRRILSVKRQLITGSESGPTRKDGLRKGSEAMSICKSGRASATCTVLKLKESNSSS